MVLCQQIDPFGGCDDSGDDNLDRDSFICPEKGNPCDCSKIIGRDHLKTQRARKFRCKSRRIKNLAQPKHLTSKYCDEETTERKIPIEILRPYEEQTPVRIKMLAFPKVRKLVSSREAYKEVINKEWYSRFDTLIKHSMLTMYSRLSNVHLPDKCCHKKMTKEDWKRHCEWLKRNALPKTMKQPAAIKRKIVSLDQLIPSMQKLAKPRYRRQKYLPFCGFISTVKESTQTHQPGERTLELAVPKKHETEEVEDDFKPFSVKPAALKYKPSQHIIALATPKANPKPASDDEFTIFGVMKRALNAAPKPHLEELAKPKDRNDDDGSVEKPLVSKKALKAKPTKRILQLAEPRNPIVKPPKT